MRRVSQRVKKTGHEILDSISHRGQESYGVSGSACGWPNSGSGGCCQLSLPMQVNTASCRENDQVLTLSYTATFREDSEPDKIKEPTQGSGKKAMWVKLLPRKPSS